MKYEVALNNPNHHRKALYEPKGPEQQVRAASDADANTKVPPHPEEVKACV